MTITNRRPVRASQGVRVPSPSSDSGSVPWENIGEVGKESVIARAGVEFAAAAVVLLDEIRVKAGWALDIRCGLTKLCEHAQWASCDSWSNLRPYGRCGAVAVLVHRRIKVP